MSEPECRFETGEAPEVARQLEVLLADDDPGDVLLNQEAFGQ